MSYPTITPQKPLPGTYLATPAPTITYGGPRFTSKAGVSSTRPDAAVASAPRVKPIVAGRVESMNPKERAARTIDDSLARESRYPDLDTYLSQGFSSDYEVPTSSAWAPFQKLKTYNIPDQIFDQYNRAQVSTSMGLLAELNHAWITIDNALYLWDYTHPNLSLVGFEEQPNSINTVKLARPRKGVFLPSITHLLVVATTAEVFLIGLGCETSNSGFKSITLYQTGMSTSIRGLDINVLASSDGTGRIFFAGSTDNDVYELTYQQEERWFQGRCGKVNHTTKSLTAFTPTIVFTRTTLEHVEQIAVDDSRNLLYTLSSNSCIRVFHLKPDGGVNLTITKHAVDIYANIGHIIISNETLNAKIKIVSISPIPAAEASRYHLMAITATGYRIYLSATGSYSWSGTPNGANVPTSMQAQHVKTPPPDTPSIPAAQRNRSISGTAYQAAPGPRNPIHTLNPTRSAHRFPPGYFFCFTSRDPLNRVDTLFISAPDSGRLARSQDTALPITPSETAMWLTLESRAEDIGICTPVAFSSRSVGGFGNELAVQYDQRSAEIAILTNNGVHVIGRRRLVDIFASLIRTAGGEEGLETQVKTLIRLYGRSETLATALAIACGQGIELSNDSRISKINDPEVQEYARKVFIEFGGRPTINENAVTDGSAPAIDAVVPSPRHAGIALYICRLLRSIWKTVISQLNKTPAGGVTVTPSVGKTKLLSIQRDLSALQEFFRVNRSFIEGLSGPEALSRAATKQEEIALQAEHRALHSLVQLVSDTVEGISFVLVLFDERVEDIVALLPEESRPRFWSLTFEELFSTTKGYEIAKELVKAIVNRNIAKGSNVETIAEALRRRCGTFCSAEDVVIFKAQEQLKRGTEAGGNSELGRNLLNESLALFEQVCENLPMDYLQSAVQQYINNQFFAGAIQLSLGVAEASDKANHAMSWIMDSRPQQDSRQASYESRKQCYELIYKVIIAVDVLSGQDPGVVDGHYTAIARRRAEAYDVIANCRDEVFLTSLYDWYLERGWSDRLLDVMSPFVEIYLQRKSREAISYSDLLWRYYSQSNRYYDAAAVQFQLAQSSFSLPLNRRIEYLGQARANASVFTADVSRGARQKLLKEVTALMDVANVQDELLQRLKEEDRIAPERKTAVLEEIGGRVMNFTDLYNMYADPGGYYDICIQIMYLAHYPITSDIQMTWQNLIESAHDEASKRGTPLPYESVADKVRNLAGRLGMSDTTFPVRILLPMLERYVLEHQLSVSPPHWVVDLFLDLQVAHERLYAVLEEMFYSDEVPFQGSNRKYIGKDLLYLIGRWIQESMRIAGGVFGSNTLARRISEMLVLLQQSGLGEDSVQLCRDLRAKIEQSLL